MKARLINVEDRLWILYYNGKIIPAEKSFVGDLFVSFKKIDQLASIAEENPKAENWNLVYPEIFSYPGETIAYVTDNLELVIRDSSVFEFLFNNEEASQDLLTVAEYAKKYNKSSEQVKVFCRTGRISGAKKIGRDWVIPSDASYPKDHRVSSGNHLLKKSNR